MLSSENCGPHLTRQQRQGCLRKVRDLVDWRVAIEYNKLHT